ncbi:MAG: hypothetical protein IT462_16560 [Planctomycetes bacterium]|nr:hypothetical protein [Planctomycetota bacterium]
MDGSHFSFLETHGAVTDDSPIIMTVPTNSPDQMNVVVGENLRDFLCLGCEVGYTILDDLAFNPAQAIKDIQNGSKDDPEWHDDTIIQRLLRILVEEFDLRPWDDVDTHLKTLHDRHFSKVISRNLMY